MADARRHLGVSVSRERLVEGVMAKLKCVVCGASNRPDETIVIVPQRSLHLLGRGVVIARGAKGYVCARPSCTKMLQKIDVAAHGPKGLARGE
jgi:hypothetical protein